MTTTQSESYPFVTKVVDLFDDWLRQRQLKELRGYEAAPGELERIAREFGVTPADLDMLVRLGSHGADELPQMLKVLDIEAPVWPARLHREPRVKEEGVIPDCVGPDSRGFRGFVIHLGFTI